MRMRVFDTGVELINAHLSSGESEGDKLKRHSDFLEIIRRGQYPPDSDAKEPETSLAVIADSACAGSSKVSH